MNNNFIDSKKTNKKSGFIWLKQSIKDLFNKDKVMIKFFLLLTFAGFFSQVITHYLLITTQEITIDGSIPLSPASIIFFLILYVFVLIKSLSPFIYLKYMEGNSLFKSIIKIFYLRNLGFFVFSILLILLTLGSLSFILDYEKDLINIYQKGQNFVNSNYDLEIFLAKSILIAVSISLIMIFQLYTLSIYSIDKFKNSLYYSYKITFSIFVKNIIPLFTFISLFFIVFLTKEYIFVNFKTNEFLNITFNSLFLTLFIRGWYISTKDMININEEI